MWVLEVVLLALALALAGLLYREWLARSRYKTAHSTEAQRAHAQTAKVDAVFASMPDGVMVLDADLRLVEWNARFPEFTGVPPAILQVGLSLAEMLRAQAAAGEFGPVDVEREVARRVALFQSGESTGTIERERPNGRTLELRRSRLAGGGFVTLYTDISQRRSAENQLRQAQKMEAVGHLTGGVAHDFNNLLTVIIGNLELAQQALGKLDLVRTQGKIVTAQGGAQRAATLTQRLLAFARRQSLEPQPIDANKIVAGMSELIRHSIGSGIELETVLAGGLWAAVADPPQLENALLNLAINARDAMPSGGKVTIETANAHLDAAYAAMHTEVTAGQYVLISVSDGGIGMTPEEAAQAFEPFFTTKEAGKGSGLGLSQVFGFIKQSNGHVKIYSEHGAGTTVKLYLPRLAAEAPVVTETEPDQPALPHARDNECVLVVEDDEDVLTYTVDALESLGYHVIGTRDAASALIVLDDHYEVVLLLTDVELPGLNGPDLAEEAMQRRPSLAVLFSTGYAANAVLHRGIVRQEFRSLNKPFTVGELAAAVRETLDVAAQDWDADVKQLQRPEA